MKKIITSQESREDLRKQGYGWNGRMVMQHKCDWDYWPDHLLSNSNVQDFVLAYNEKHSNKGITRLDMYIKWRNVA